MGVGEGWIGNDFIYELSTRGHIVLFNIKNSQSCIFIETGGAGIPLLIEMERKFDKTPNNAIVG